MKPLPTLHAGPSDSPGFLLWRMSNQWQRQQRAALQPLGLTHTQFVMLAVVTWFSTQAPLTQARLSQLTGSDPMTTSQTVRTLLANGLVERAAHPTDTRAKVISVSDTGRALAHKAVQVVEEVDRQFFAPLGARQPQLVELFQMLIEKDPPPAVAVLWPPCNPPEASHEPPEENQATTQGPRQESQRQARPAQHQAQIHQQGRPGEAGGAGRE